ncbi:hypothetical protein [Mycolicibacterium neoaurum]|uniref:hypothetical protein n=1 Tax=Mycolicibacterium neoaurum TaxID=1795 RepID=UPI001F4CECCD|nr:hypothetical protein [Mycolicibacterium neoaurum]
MDLSADQLKAVDATAKRRDITAYEKGEVTVESEPQKPNVVAKAGQRQGSIEEAEANNAKAEEGKEKENKDKSQK